MRTPARRLLVMALATAAVVMLTGCSGTITPFGVAPFGMPPLEERPPADVITAASGGMQTETFRVEFTMDLTFSETATGRSATVSTSGEGVVDTPNQRASMTLALPSELGAGSEVKMIVDGDAGYVQASPEQAAQLGVEPGHRKSSVDASFELPDLGFGMEMHITMETWDFGVAVDVEPPPADQVVEAPADPLAPPEAPAAPGQGIATPPPPGTGAGATDPGAPAAPPAACDLLTAAEIEQVVGVPVAAEGIGADHCRYEAVGGASVALPLVELDVQRYVTTPAQFQERVQSTFEITADFWPEAARQPATGLGQAAEFITDPTNVSLLVFTGTEMFVIELRQEAPAQGQDQRLEPAAQLARIVLGRV